MEQEFIRVFTGPMVGSTFVFVPINVTAALLTLILVIRIGKGRLNIPVILIGLGFLVSAAIPIVFGIEYLWIVPLLQTIFGALAILALMKVFGVFSLIFKSKRPSLFVNSTTIVKHDDNQITPLGQ